MYNEKEINHHGEDAPVAPDAPVASDAPVAVPDAPAAVPDASVVVPDAQEAPDADAVPDKGEKMIAHLMVMESLKNFHSNTQRDENTQKNGKMFEEHVKSGLVSLGYNDASNLKKTTYKNMLSEIKKCYTTSVSIINTKEIEQGKLLFQQPYGSQCPPDFLLVDVLKDTINFQPIEVKTGKKMATWNNNYPKDDWIYIFCGEEGVTYFLGKNMIKPKEKEIIEEYKMARKELNKIYNKKLEDENSITKLVEYYKFEHRSNVNYKKDKMCEQREKEVDDILLRLTGLAL